MVETTVKPNFQQRYQSFLAHYDLTPSSLAEKLKDDATAKYYRYRDGKALPGQEVLEQIHNAFPYLNPNWFTRGVGPIDLREVKQEDILSKITPADATKIARLEAENDGLRKQNNHLLNENNRLWRMVLPKEVQQELDFLKASSQTTALGIMDSKKKNIRPKCEDAMPMLIQFDK